MSLEERLDTLEAALTKQEEPKEPPKRCIFCVVYNNDVIENYNVNSDGKLVSIKACYDSNSWLIASEIVREYLRKNEISCCNHENHFLTDISIPFTKGFAKYLECKSTDKYHPLRLFEVIFEILEKETGPKILVEFLKVVGKNWIYKLDPNDFDIGYVSLLKEYGEGFNEGKSVPPYHPNIPRTRKEWAENCKCDDCQQYYVWKREELEEAEKFLGSFSP